VFLALTGHRTENTSNHDETPAKEGSR
jgi:hypothetical protein